MTAKELVPWLTVAGMILGAGLWLGRLQQQVSDLKAEQQFFHGSGDFGKGR